MLLQRSAYPDAYAQWESIARELVDNIAGSSGSASAVSSSGGGPSSSGDGAETEDRCGTTFGAAASKCDKCPNGTDGE